MDVTPLAEALDENRFGGKTATLARLLACGLAVPDGVALAVDVLDEWFEDSVPPHAHDAVGRALQRLGGGPVAVRSSAIGEDGPSASFAGMFVSHLDVVDAPQAIEAIASVRASARLARVTAYRGAAGPPRLAVLVQRQVRAHAAGVAFTADPVTGAPDRVRIAAVLGTGDALWSGRTTAEDWEVRGTDVPVRLAASSTGGESGPAPVLDTAAVAEVAQLARRVEEVLATPIDVEWVHDGRDVVVVQARPISVVPRPPSGQLDGAGWQKDEAHYPEPVTPFGASVLWRDGGGMSDGVAAMTAEFGLLVDRLDTRVVGGEVYVRPRPVIGPAEPSRRTPPAWVLGVASRLAPPLRARMRAAGEIEAHGMVEELPRRWWGEWRREWVDRIARLRDVDVAELSDRALLDHADELIRLADDGQVLHFRLFMPYAVALHEWARAAEAHLGWSLTRAMAVLPSPASVEGVRELEAIARALPTASVEAVTAGPDAVAALRARGHDEIADRLQVWIAEHAWRTSNYEPGAPALAERPALIARMLAEAAGSASGEVEDRSLNQLEYPPELDGAPTEVLVAYRRAHDVAPIREDNVVLTDNVPFGLLRRWLLEVSDRLVARGALDRRDDAAFLELEELRALLAGHASFDPRERVARRRGEHAWVRMHPGPRVVGASSPPPDLSHLPAAGRRMNEALMWMMGLEYPPQADDDPDVDEQADGVVLRGIGASVGVHRGPVRVVRGEPDFPRLAPGDVLVCPVTTPAWTVLFATAGAMVTDGGGVLSHAAIVAREHGLPAVVATRTATRDLRDGEHVVVDGTRGVVQLDARVARRPPDPHPPEGS